MFITLTNTPFLSAYRYHSNCTIARATDKIPCDLKWSFWCYSAEVHKPVEWCLRVCSYLQRIYHIQSRVDENGFLWWTFIWHIAMHLPLLFFFLLLKTICQCIAVQHAIFLALPFRQIFGWSNACKKFCVPISKIPTCSHLHSSWNLWLSNPAVFSRKGCYRQWLSTVR